MTEFNGAWHNPIERVTGAAAGITSDHASIHAGEGFGGNVYAASVAANTGVIAFTVTIPEGKTGHLKQAKFGTTGSLARMEIIEAPTTVTGGSAFTMQNHRRVPPVGDFGGTALAGVTAVSGGTVLDTFHAGGGGVGGGQGGHNVADQEYVMYGGIQYAFKLTNLATTTQNLWGNFFLYLEDHG